MEQGAGTFEELKTRAEARAFAERQSESMLGVSFERAVERVRRGELHGTPAEFVVLSLQDLVRRK